MTALARERRPSAALARKAFWAIFALAAGLRLALSLVNTEANDDHMTPIYMIMDSGRMPARGECQECYQPKLFYAAGALLLKVLGLGKGRAAIVAMQLVNCAFGIGTLWVLLLFTRRLPASPGQGLAGFSLAAFNPYLVAIHAQASNDAWVVFFSTLALYSLLLYLEDGRRRHLVLLTSGAILASLTKGNGVALSIGVCLLLLVKLLRGWPRARPRREALAHLLVFVFAYLLVVPFFGQYAYNYRTYGTPFVTNLERDPPPHFFRETYPARPGITSVFNSYFTFRFLQLLQRPMINTSRYVAPYHQTSFWTLLYGTTHCVNYYQWPETWQSRTRAMVWLARAIFVLALVPTALLLLGLIRSAGALGRSLRRGDLGSLLAPRAVLLLFSVGFLAFLVTYSLFYRDVGSVKAIYLYPGLLGFLGMFHEGYALCVPRKRALPWVNAAIAALCLLYVADIASVIARLAS